MEIELKGQQWLTLGAKGSGKSHFNQWLTTQMSGDVVVFDPMDEYPDEPHIKRLVPENRRGEEAITKLQRATEFVEYNKESIGYFIVDEISRFHQKGGLLNDALGELIDLNRHWDIGVGFVARRPTQVHTDIREMSDFLFLFSMRGVNDVKILDNVSQGLSGCMQQMNREKPEHSYIAVGPSRQYNVYPPV